MGCGLLRLHRDDEANSLVQEGWRQSWKHKGGTGPDDVITVSAESGAPPSPLSDSRSGGIRGLTEQERSTAWNLSGFHIATPGQAQPLVLWVLGPSAVGKTTLSAKLAPGFGVPRMNTEGAVSLASDEVLDAVIIDGEFFRDAHATYLKWTKSPEWASAYPAIKPIVNKEKDDMLKVARAQRKHLVIPQTCLNLESCLSAVRELRASGYTNHVLAIVAPREEVIKRGYAREQQQGKRYAPSEFERSVAAFGPMIGACDGRYEIVRAHRPSSGHAEDQPYLLTCEVLSKGPCGSDAELPDLQVHTS